MSDLKAKSPYFEVTDASMVIPLDRVIEREPADPERLERARVLMEKAREGQGPKRLPIKVVEQGDGTYRVLDGNTTLHVLRELGETKAVVELQK